MTLSHQQSEQVACQMALFARTMAGPHHSSKHAAATPPSYQSNRERESCSKERYPHRSSDVTSRRSFGDARKFGAYSLACSKGFSCDASHDPCTISDTHRVFRVPRERITSHGEHPSAIATLPCVFAWRDSASAGASNHLQRVPPKVNRAVTSHRQSTCCRWPATPR